MRLHKDLDSAQLQLQNVDTVAIEKLNNENERLRDLFKRAELNW